MKNLTFAIGLCAMLTACGGGSDSITQQHIVLIGDSIFGLMEAPKYFPEYRVTNAGVNGQTTRQIFFRFQSILDQKPDIIVIDGGTNDLTEGNASADYMRSMILSAKSSGSKVVVVGVYKMPWLEPALSKWNADVKRSCETWGVPYIDNSEIDSGLKEDRVHPSDAGYVVLAQNIKGAL